MQAWLVDHHVFIKAAATKPVIWRLIKPLLKATTKIYILDKLLYTFGFDVQILPPYHCQYNLIELMRAFCKTYYNKHITRLTG